MTFPTVEALALSEPISPELVLVDADLRARLLAAQSQATSAEQPFPPRSYPSRFSADADAAVVRPSARRALRTRTHARRVTRLLVAAAAVVSFVIGLSNPLRVDAMRSQAVPGAAIAADAAPPAASPRTTPVIGTAGSRPAPSPAVAFVTRAPPHGSGAPVIPAVDPMTPPTLPTFVPAPELSARGQRVAWASLPGVTAYDVELVRNGSAVFAKRTSSTTMFLPVSGHPAGSGQMLAAGIYTWHVWPVRGGRRVETAIVNSTLLVL